VTSGVNVAPKNQQNFSESIFPIIAGGHPQEISMHKAGNHMVKTVMPGDL
jgi:hypothetical protein